MVLPQSLVRRVGLHFSEDNDVVRISKLSGYIVPWPDSDKDAAVHISILFIPTWIGAWRNSGTLHQHPAKASRRALVDAFELELSFYAYLQAMCGKDISPAGTIVFASREASRSVCAKCVR